MLNKLERKFGGLAIPNLTLYLVVAQVFGFILARTKPGVLADVQLVPAMVLDGEWWRLFTFVVVPPSEHPILLFFALYLLYLMGNALEAQWGAFRYTVFLGVGYLATVGASFFAPASVATNAFLGGSVFLAFAYLNPDFQLHLFFILPVKVKWLALLTWAGYLFTLLFTPLWSVRLAILASVANFLLFFWRDLWLRARHGHRKMVSQTRSVHESSPDRVFHRCAACGVTDKSDPQAQFRYCPDCEGSPGYCMDHIHDHEHRTAPEVSHEVRQ